jgi:UDP-GlcNAc:undecaprenyl-phosphate GlcNAc-1-phosphate transferase
VDYPAARKVHVRPTPKGGGLSIFLAVAAVCFLFPFNRTSDVALLLGLGLLIVVLGLVDDVRPLPWQLRLGVQFVAASVMVGELPAEFGWAERAAAVLWIVGLTNAFNMLDNMDALSAGVAWIAAGALALLVVGTLTPRAGEEGGILTDDAARRVVPLLVLMGALTGFLWFNRPPARIFMGDAGSTFLGFFLGFESLAAAAGPDQPCPWAAPVSVLAVPWYDLSSVVLLRLSQGRSPFHADKQHLSHRLVGLGLRPPAAVLVIYLLALASGLGGVVLYQLHRTRAAEILGVDLACWWLAVAGIELGVRRGGGGPKEG